jgi:hypothetical protein
VPPPRDIAGQRFGRLRAIRRLRSDERGRSVWLCRCRCGQRPTIPLTALVSGNTKSCGCLRADQIGRLNLRDLTDLRFGRLLAIRSIGTSSAGRVWLCRCECGNTKKSVAKLLLGGKVKSCGCLPAYVKETRFKDLTGRRFGRLIALTVTRGGGMGRRYWVCRCDCGNMHKVSLSALTSGDIKSCGCLKHDVTTARNTTHGGSYSQEYSSFNAAKARCNRKTHKKWADYGGRGIRFLFKSFPQFLKVLGPKPGPEYSIDRFPDNDGHYEPGNVRWATPKQQNSNRRPARKPSAKKRTAIGKKPARTVRRKAPG